MMNNPEFAPDPALRPAMEIQRAHDLLVGIILGEVPELEITDEIRDKLSAAASVLCWVLKHDHNLRFQELLDALEKAGEKVGYSFRSAKGRGGDCG
jgi:hypothetical protein